LIPVLRSLADLAGAEAARWRRGAARSAIGLALALLAVLAALEGLNILLIGLYASLLRTQPAWEAGLLVGGVVIVLAALALAVIARRLRSPRAIPPLPPPGARPESARLDSAPAVLGATAAELIGRTNLRARDIALAALVAGLVLGASPDLRRRLFSRKKVMSDE
jgi:hypothetical protein